MEGLDEPILLKRSIAIRLIVGGVWLVLLLVLALTASSTGWAVVLPWLAAVTILAAIVFLYERGLEIEIAREGIARRRSFPSQKRTFLPWESVETVSADLKIVLRQGVLGGISSQESDYRLEVAGGGERIVLRMPLYQGGEEEIKAIIALARPAAVRRTLDKARTEGGAPLGPLTIGRDAIVIRRWAVLLGGGLLRLVGVGWLIELAMGPVIVGLADLQGVSLEYGSLKFKTAERTVRVSAALVPNAVYFPEMLSSLRG